MRWGAVAVCFFLLFCFGSLSSGRSAAGSSRRRGPARFRSPPTPAGQSWPWPWPRRASPRSGGRRRPPAPRPPRAAAAHTAGAPATSTAAERTAHAAAPPPLGPSVRLHSATTTHTSISFCTLIRCNFSLFVHSTCLKITVTQIEFANNFFFIMRGNFLTIRKFEWTQSNLPKIAPKNTMDNCKSRF
jgi:hypothetical protein